MAFLEKYLRLRERMRPYIRELMTAAHQRGSPIIRPLFYDFPADAKLGRSKIPTCLARMFSWHLSCLRGSAPATFICPRERVGSAMAAERCMMAARFVNESAPLDHLPVFFREDGIISIVKL